MTTLVRHAAGEWAVGASMGSPVGVELVDTELCRHFVGGI